jgi:uridine phosphorylase
VSDDSTAPPDVVTTRTIARDPDDPGVIRLGSATFDRQAEVQASTIEVLRELLADAESGDVREIVGVAYSSDGIPAFFCSHRDAARASGALAAAQHTLLKRWLDE